jgi:hypothetical protein
MGLEDLTELSVGVCDTQGGNPLGRQTIVTVENHDIAFKSNTVHHWMKLGSITGNTTTAMPVDHSRLGAFRSLLSMYEALVWLSSLMEVSSTKLSLFNIAAVHVGCVGRIFEHLGHHSAHLPHLINLFKRVLLGNRPSVLFVLSQGVNAVSVEFVFKLVVITSEYPLLACGVGRPAGVFSIFYLF